MNIVIADSVVRETLSPERQFHGIPSNLGAREIARLMGRGRAYGDGPLPSLIRAAADSGGRTGLVLLREVATEGGGGSSEGASEARKGTTSRHKIVTNFVHHVMNCNHHLDNRSRSEM